MRLLDNDAMDADETRELEVARENWEKDALARSRARGGERDEIFATSAGPTNSLYTPLDLADHDYDNDIGYPGAYPYTRGVQPTMYRGRLWSIRQYAGFGMARETNERFRFLLGEGQPGLSVAFDLPTQLGYDSDDPQSEGEVGKVGVAIDSLRDLEVMFEGIPLDQVSTSMTINAPASILAAMYIVAGEKQGVGHELIQGTAQNDILKEYVARGTYIFPPRPSLRLAVDLVTYCAAEAPKFNSISVSGYHIRDAGSTAVQEIAFAFSNAVAYLEEAVKRGASVDDVAPRISWIFNTQNNFFEEVAKYRALRRLWARLIKERFGAMDPRSWMLRTHVQTGGATLTAQQPQNNIVRATLQALASVLGGVQSLALSCYDEALALPTPEAQRMAVRTQQILAHESGVTDTIDPLAGSYYVETLTNELEASAVKLMDRVEAMGGAIAAIEAGFMQQEIQEASVAWQRDVESGRRTIVGVNKFRADDEPEVGIFRPNPEAAAAQITALNHLRAERDNRGVGASLSALRVAARDPDVNLMPPIMEGVRCYATIGEICGLLREEWGEYTPVTAI